LFKVERRGDLQGGNIKENTGGTDDFTFQSHACRCSVLETGVVAQAETMIKVTLQLPG